MERLMEWWQEFSWRQRILVVSVGLAILSLGWWLTIARASPEPLPAAIPPASVVSGSEKGGSRVANSGVSSASQVSSHDTRVFVDVQGAVKQPGLYQFGPEMRVADAVKAAGGLSAHADHQQVNLATRLTDQQQLYIPAKGEKAAGAASAPTGKATGSQSTSQATAVVNLNTATVADLQQLTGIGEKKAQKIVDYRTEHGAFKSVNDLTQVPGFGEKTVANLEDQLTT